MIESINCVYNGISIIVCASNYDFADRIFDNYIRQDFMKKELIIIVRNNYDDFDEWICRSGQYPMTRVYQQNESKSIEECLDYCIEQSVFDYIVIFEENHYYDAGHVLNSIQDFEQNNVNGTKLVFKNPYSGTSQK